MSSETANLPQTKRDLIVDCALRVFGEHGIEATSLREIAKAAEVSPALIVHHFGGKEGLIAAADETAIYQFAAAYESAEMAEGGLDLLRQRAEQTVQVMRERPDVSAYLGRALVEGTPGTGRLFQLIMDGGRVEIFRLMERGALRPDADRLWALLHHFFLIWAPLCFRPLLEREVLSGSLLDEKNMDRWVTSTVELFSEGLYRDERQA